MKDAEEYFNTVDKYEIDLTEYLKGRKAMESDELP